MGPGAAAARAMNVAAPPSVSAPAARTEIDASCVADLVAALDRSSWTGEVLRDPGARAAWSVDNSIYRIPPAAVVFPRTTLDLATLCRLASRHRVPLTARGGGTGTNGQSLTAGLMVDTSRHMRAIHDFDPAAMTVTVQPGVVLDQLNAFLSEHGMFFPPTVSTASRATIAGMLATDASGKGSRHYGRTSDHVEAIEMVLADGSVHAVSACGLDRDQPRLAGIDALLRAELAPRRALIDDVFPRMNRGLTGYNLKDALDADGAVHLVKLLAGSEGTLALTGDITLRVRRKAAHTALGLLAYQDFMVALAQVGRLIEADPLAVEILDDRVLALARRDPIWAALRAVLGDAGGAAAFLVVEFIGETRDEVAAKLGALHDLLDQAPGHVVAVRTVTDPAEVASIWSLRKQSVGLLGAVEGRRSGIAFVEDCAVPPEALPDFVAEFRAILDARDVEYGMYGHADVGCLHVRPLLDMTDAADRAMVRAISDEVAALAKRHGGLLWGEHGRGFRAEYSPLYFGHELYGVLRRIKRHFDPGNLLNPGKLAVPEGMDGAPTRIDEAPMRGVADERIAPQDRKAFDRALACNGNAACHHWDAAEAMCPSYKATRDGAQSPKGRAALMREWLFLRSSAGEDDARTAQAEASLAASLDTCLSCRACATRCPVRVDIPTMKSRFLEARFRTRARPARDHLVRVMEPATLLAGRAPRLANAILGSAPGRGLLRRGFALDDLPTLSPAPVARGMQELGIPAADGAPCEAVLLTDSFTGLFETQVPLAAARLLRTCGIDLCYAPPVATAKALEVRGYRGAHAVAQGRIRGRIARIMPNGGVAIGVEPVATQAWIDAVGRSAPAPIGLDSYLDGLRHEGRLLRATRRAPYRLLAHCTEKTADPEVPMRWVRIFEAMGLGLDVARVGCCGMAGLFGHEREHRGLSREIFDLSWRREVEGDGPEPLATGFSCRCQAGRFAGRALRHPVQALVDALS